MVQVMVGKVSGNMDPSRAQRGSGKTKVPGVSDSQHENYRKTRRRPGGSITSTTSTNPPRRDSTPLPSTSPRLNPKAVEFFPANLNPTPQSNNIMANLETRKPENPVPVGYPPGKEAVPATRDQLLSDAAYAATLYLEELEALDPLLAEAYSADLFLEEADYQNGVLEDRKVVFTRQFLKLQEDSFWAFQPGEDTGNGGDTSHVTPPPTTSSPPPHNQQYEEIVQLGSLTLMPQSSSEGNVETPPEPGFSILDPSVLDSAPREGTVRITADLCTPEVDIEMEAAARRAGEAVNNMEKRFHEVEQCLEGFDAKASPGSEPLAPQLRLLCTEYRRTKICSLDLAIKIANYSRRFYETMIPNCLDNLIPLSERKDALKDYINEAGGFATASEEITIQWAQIRYKYLRLIQSFSGWESLQETANLNGLGHLKQTMVDLEAQMESSTRNAKIMNLALAGGTLTAIALASICLWKFRNAPGDLVKLTTYIQELTENTAIFRVITGIKVQEEPQNTRERIQQTQAAIYQEETQIQGRRVSRDQLEALGSREATTFSEVTVLCEKIWTQTRNDAVNLREYLEAGERNANHPFFLRGYLNQARKAYILMASYLQRYADAIKIV